VSLVMGIDQHRAQISVEWIDTVTGEVFRARVAPADRAAVRKFLKRFVGEGLEVALEATTGWRFLVEELERAGAEVHLAEPTETSGMKSKKKRAKTDWADARHLRELLLIGRLPESWIPPAHILDLRARVRTRHALPSADRVAAADPCGASPPRRASAAQCAHARAARVARRPTRVEHRSKPGRPRTVIAEASGSS
jgi:hypothetical protein